MSVPVMRGRDQFHRYRGAIMFLSRLDGALPRRCRLRLLERFRKTRGKKGLAARYILLKTLARACGDNVAVFPDVYLLNPHNISIGSNVSIQPMCYIEGGDSTDPAHGVFIGNDVSIAHGCTLIPGNHISSDLSLPIKDQGVAQGAIHISSNVWFGARVVVLANVNVAEGCILAAGAVLTKSTIENGIYAGVPAKLVKKRGD